MSELHFPLVPPFAGGMALGALFFAGLWLSVRKLSLVKRPALLMVISYVARMLVGIGGLYLLSDGDWRRLAAALTGFVLARIVMVRLLARDGQRSTVSVRGGR